MPPLPFHPLRQSQKLTDRYFRSIAFYAFSLAAVLTVSGCVSHPAEQSAAADPAPIKVDEPVFTDIESVQAFLMSEYVAAERLAVEDRDRIKKKFGGEGKIFIGRISPPPGVRISSRAIFEDDNSFMTAIYPGRTLGFFAHGYDPLEVTEGKHVWGPVYDVGVVEFKKSSPETLRTVVGSVQADTAAGGKPPKIQVILSLPNNLTLSNDGIDWQRYTRVNIQTGMLKSGDTFRMKGLSPAYYTISIYAEGYVSKGLKIAPDLRGEIDLGSIQMEKARELRFDYVQQMQRGFPEQWGRPQSIKILCDNNRRFRFSRFPDPGSGSMYMLNLRVEGDEVRPYFRWGDAEFFLLGEGELEDYLISKAWVERIEEMSPSKSIVLESGKVYYFRSKSQEVSSLFAISNVEH